MKFATVALLGLASAIKLHQHHQGGDDHEHHGPPTGAEIIEHCDKDGDQKLTKEEAWNCFAAEAPSDADSDDIAAGKAKFDEQWAAGNFGDHADAAEIDAAIAAYEKEEKKHKKGKKEAAAALAKLMKM